MAKGNDAARYRANLQGEYDSAGLYRALADAEPDPRLRRSTAGSPRSRRVTPNFGAASSTGSARAPEQLGLGWRTRALAWLARRFGPQMVLPTVNALDSTMSAIRQAGRGRRAGPAGGASARTPASCARSRTRYRVAFRAVHWQRWKGAIARSAATRCAPPCLAPMTVLSPTSASSWASPGRMLREKTILLTGIAGLAAGACSMAMGEWLSVNSSRELAQRQIAIEAAELEQSPEEEIEEIALIYEAKGLARPQAEALARQMMSNKKTALDTLVREELGIDPKELGGSAWTAAISSFLLFSIGAIFPVLPFFLFTRHDRDRGEPCCRRLCAGRDRRRDVVVHRPRACFLGLSPAGDRVRCRGADLRDRAARRRQPRGLMQASFDVSGRGRRRGRRRPGCRRSGRDRPAGFRAPVSHRRASR